MPEENEAKTKVPPVKKTKEEVSNDSTAGPRSHHKSKEVSGSRPVATESFEDVVEAVSNGDYGEGEALRQRIRASGHSLLKVEAAVRRELED